MILSSTSSSDPPCFCFRSFFFPFRSLELELELELGCSSLYSTLPYSLSLSLSVLNSSLYARILRFVINIDATAAIRVIRSRPVYVKLLQLPVNRTSFGSIIHPSDQIRSALVSTLSTLTAQHPKTLGPCFPAPTHLRLPLHWPSL